MVVLMLIPLAGVFGLAIEVGNVTLQQRVQQHAADSAVLAAAQSNDSTVDSGATLARYARDAKAAAAKYPISNATVSTIKVDCPGSASGSLDCYQTTISRTQNLYLAALVGVKSMTPTAVAVANLGSKQNDCFIGTQHNTNTLKSPAGGDGIYINGSNSGFEECYLRSYGKVECSGGSTTFKGINASSYQCSAPFTYNTQQWTDPYGLGSYKAAAAGVTCSADINSLSWTSGTTQYARLCAGGNVTLTADLDISSNGVNRILYLDGTGVDLNGHKLSATQPSGATSADHTGTTIVVTNNSGSTLGTNNVIFNNGAGNGTSKAATLSILAPGDAPGGTTGGATANFAVIVDPTVQPSSSNQCQFDPNSNALVNLNIVGVIYAPWCDIHLNANNTSNLGNYSNCFSLIGNAIDATGGKLTLANGASSATSGCAAAGITTPTDYFGQVALVK